ncbi:hypothetical protein Tco_0528908 [Tanacetum coccineum]
MGKWLGMRWWRWQAMWRERRRMVLGGMDLLLRWKITVAHRVEMDEDGRVENKSSMGSRLLATLVAEIIGEVGRAPDVYGPMVGDG